MTPLSTVTAWVVTLNQLGDPLAPSIEVIAEDYEGTGRHEIITTDTSLRIGDLLCVQVTKVASEAAS